MATIEFSKTYGDGRIITVTYQDAYPYTDLNGRGAEANKKRAIKQEKRHQDGKYEEFFTSSSSENKVLDAYMELCESMKFD